MTLRKSEEEKVVRGKGDRSIGKTSMLLWKKFLPVNKVG